MECRALTYSRPDFHAGLLVTWEMKLKLCGAFCCKVKDGDGDDDGMDIWRNGVPMLVGDLISSFFLMDIVII